MEDSSQRAEPAPVPPPDQSGAGPLAAASPVASPGSAGPAEPRAPEAPAARDAIPPLHSPPPVLPPRGGPAFPGGAPGPAPRAPLPNRRRSLGWLWALAGVGLVGMAGLVLAGFLIQGFEWSSPAGLGGRSSGGGDSLREVVLEQTSSRDKIVVVDVQGVISSDPVDHQGTTLVTHIEEQLERAAEDLHVKAVVLKIDSPGGEVMASDEIYKLIQDFQEDHEKPVVASMGTVAASGGYYVAAPCRWIVAHELTITGSIGVIMHGYNWRGLMDKVGVTPQVFKSGALKDMLSPDKREEDISLEERRIVQNLVNETFDRFKGVVEEGRGLARSRNEDNTGEESDQGRELSKDWKEFADGRLLSGKDAWKLGMVDELGDFSAAIHRAAKLAGIEDARVVQYLRPPTFGSLFRLLGQGGEARVKLDLGVKLPQVRAGLHYLAPSLIR